MKTNKNFQFILNKITDINVALFTCQTSSVLRIPTTIINTYSVDDNGNILFFTPRPKQLLSQFEKEFPVDLNYFRKDLCYYMNIHGYARIINDPEELYAHDLSREQMEQALNKDILVKVKILKAHYYEKDWTRKNVFNQAKSFIYSLLARVEPSVKTFDFSSKPQLHNYGF